MSSLGISIPTRRIEEFCQRRHIKNLALFGSVLEKDRFGPESDVDVLVEFEPGHVPGLELITIQEELSKILGGRQVDLVTPKFLNRRIREQVEKSAQVQYAKE